MNFECPYCGWPLTITRGWDSLEDLITCLNFFACGAEWDRNGTNLTEGRVNPDAGND
jgi:hypothetical protein